jgi:4-hydroxyproline epimerase
MSQPDPSDDIFPPSVRVIDSQTEGEPTRVVVEGLPELGDGDAAARLEIFKSRHDRFRSAMVGEPRGYDAVVGALLLPPKNPAAVAQMIFFNNVSTLFMCGHGTIGVVATLAWLGRIGPGRHLLETPVGDVEVELEEDGTVAVDNVFSYRHEAGVVVETGQHGRVEGDVAWGGNWFFLVKRMLDREMPPLRLEALDALTNLTWDVRTSLGRHGIKGRGGQEIDHIEVFGAPTRADADSRNFVLCPGKAYDRSPCGTGTSAKMACLAADGKLQPGQVWGQESIVGSLFRGSIETAEEGGILGVRPRVRGKAFVTADCRLLFDPRDPFRFGIG